MRLTEQQIKSQYIELPKRVEAAAKLAAKAWELDQGAAIDLGIVPERGFSLSHPMAAWLRHAALRIVPKEWNWDVMETTEGAHFALLEYRQ